jgi:hypothetical protein
MKYSTMILINQSDEPRADRELEEQLRGLLGQRVSDLRRVRLFIGAQAVFLRGPVRSFYIKQLLIHAVQRAAGQRRVIDEVSVLSSSDLASTSHLHKVTAACIALALAVFVSGCSKSEPGELAVFHVHGQITLAGKPAAGAQVVFHSKDGVQRFPAPRATSDREGNYEVTTYRQADGAPEGQYVVTAELRSMTKKDGEFVPGPSVLPLVYGNPKTTTLTAKVESRDNEVPIRIVR